MTIIYLVLAALHVGMTRVPKLLVSVLKNSAIETEILKGGFGFGSKPTVLIRFRFDTGLGSGFKPNHGKECIPCFKNL